MPLYNAELLLVISAASVEEADELAEYIAKETANDFGPVTEDAGNTPGGVVATASVESVAEKRPRAA